MELAVRTSISVLGFLTCLLAPVEGLAQPCVARASRPVRARGGGLGPLVVSVRDCGAKGDGVTDDSGAIQAALQALPSAGGKLLVPAGVYLLGVSHGSLPGLPEGASVPSALVLQGENQVLQGAGNQSVLKLMPGRKMRMLTLAGAGAVVEDLVLDGNAPERATPAGNQVDALVVITGHRARLRNCEVRNGLEAGVRSWQAGEWNMENCSVHDNGGAGVVLAGGTGARVVGNRVERNRQGLWSAWGARDLFLGNNVIRGNQGAGILVGGPAAAGTELISGITIAANLVEANGRDGSPGIAIAGAQNGIIQGNTVINNLRAGIELREEPGTPPAANNRNWRLEDNLCSNTTPARTQSEGIAVLGRAENVQLRGNRCENNGTSVLSQVVVPNQTTVNPDWASANHTTFVSPGTPPPDPRPEDGQRLVVRGVVKTGRELGISHCQEGSYLQYPNGPLHLRARSAGGATANLDLSYAGKTVSVTGAYQAAKCEALLCICDDYLLADAVFVESGP